MSENRVKTLAMTFDPSSNQIPKNPAVRRVWILGRLRLRGTSLRRLAAEHGVSPQAMSAALTGPSARLKRVIADACGVSVQALFPEWFTAEGQPLSWTREQPITPRHRGNVQEEDAA